MGSGGPSTPSVPTPRCGIGGINLVDGRWQDCKGVVGGACCYQTHEQACIALGCAPDECILKKSLPPQAACSK